MKGTILYAEYDEGTGVSTVTKQTKYGTFTRSVRVHPQDEDIANQYDGCRFAEMKCDIAAYKTKARFLKERALGIGFAINAIITRNEQKFFEQNYNTEDETLIFLEGQLSIAWRNYEDAQETYEILRDTYKNIVEMTLNQRRSFRKKIATSFFTEKDNN